MKKQIFALMLLAIGAFAVGADQASKRPAFRLHEHSNEQFNAAEGVRPADQAGKRPEFRLQGQDWPKHLVQESPAAEMSSELTKFISYLGRNQNECDSTHIKDLASVAQIALNALKSIQVRQKQKVEAEESRLSDVNYLIRQVEADMRSPSDDKKSNKANGQE